MMGPPLSGKGTFIRQKLGIAENDIFSVRLFFEKERTNIKSFFSLPPVGTFLDDDAVFQGFKIWLEQKRHGDKVALDGFPGSAEQLQSLKVFFREQDIEWKYIWLSIERREAYERMKNRKVCFRCDGGVEQAAEANGNCCLACGSQLQKRSDDTENGFYERWNGFESRREALMKAVNLSVDLHIHSNASDGTRTIDEIFNLAVKKNLNVIAITDHDTMKNIPIALKKRGQYGISCIPGMEMSAVWNNRIIHILGYGMDNENELIGEYERICLEKINERDVFALERIYKKKKEPYLTEYENYTYPYQAGGWKLLNYLLTHKIIKTLQEYCEYVAQGVIAEVEYLDIEAVINIIHRSGGHAIVAHPGSYQNLNYRELLLDLLDKKIDGVEAFHPHNTDEITVYCLEWAEQHNKVVTGGSDSHGNLPDRTLGIPIIFLNDLNLYGLTQFI